MSARERLAELRELAEKATPGPWKLWGMQVLADPVGDSNLSTALPIADTTDPHRGLRTWNAQLIAESRTEMPKLVGALEALLDQHRPFTHHFIAPPAGSVEICDECRSSWPCATARLIEEALR